ncbi:MAG: hypothetical protein OXP28_07940 [Gammaproteobacteria bacterium]|nr:hypothetical protein [Gammaproteobacteria bacterium]
MELIRQGLNLDFMSRRRHAVRFSAALLAISILSLAFRGLEFGIDFTGGTLVEVGYPQAVELEPVRATLERAGFEGAVVQHFGTAQDVLIRIAPRDDVDRSELSNRAFDALRAKDSSVDLRRVEFVGPQVGEELTEPGVIMTELRPFGALPDEHDTCSALCTVNITSNLRIDKYLRIHCGDTCPILRSRPTERAHR